MSLFAELKRRNVFKVAAVYAIVAWVLLQVSENLASALNLPGWFHSGTAFVLILGFPIAVIFAWAYELTPDGIKRDHEVDPGQSITGKTGKKLNRIITAGLALAVAWFLLDEFYLEPREAEQEVAAPAVEESVVQLRKSVAVLPFRSMSSGEDDEAFSDGLTEEILNSLAALPELLVTARTSSFYFKGQDLPITEIAATLGVDHVVEGSVRRQGDELRITAQLIRANDGFHLWSNTYDRTLEDVFEVQENIANNIAEALNVVLDESRREQMRAVGIRNVEAFIPFSRGSEALNRYHETYEFRWLIEADEYFSEATKSDPTLARAHFAHSELHGHLVSFYNFIGAQAWDPFVESWAPELEEYSPGDADESLIKIQQSIDLAVRHAASRGERDFYLLEQKFFSDDWSNIRQLLDASVANDYCPSAAWGHYLLSPFLPVRAEAFAAKWVHCDPMNVGTYQLNMDGLLFGGKVQEAADAASQVYQRFGGGVGINGFLKMTHLATDPAGEPPEGMQSDELHEIQLLAAQGNLAAAEAMFLELAREDNPELDLPGAQDWATANGPNFWVLQYAAATGNREMANAVAERMDQVADMSVTLLQMIVLCLCGAPFDLEATPNLQKRITSAGFDWPPATIIHYPAKDW